MQLTQALLKKTLLVVFLAMAIAIVGAVFAYKTQADTRTGIDESHRVFVVMPDRGTIYLHVVIVNTSVWTTAVEESIEVPGGVGGYQLKMHYHTNDGEIELMRDCGDDIDRYPFCLRFNENEIWVKYMPNTGDLPLGFRQNRDCLYPTSSIYYCKYSSAVYVTADLEFYAEGRRPVYLSKGYPKWSIVLHGGAQMLKNTWYEVHD